MTTDTYSTTPETDGPTPDDGHDGRVEHLTVAERTARGRAERAAVPRSTHAAWEASDQRRDPVEMLEEQAQTRIPELVPIRYGRMLVSPFTFFRGAAYLMAADLAATARTGLRVQLCGDAHLSNFGGFAAPDRRLTFSVNDFDETLPGPFEWDVKRLVASFAVAGRDRGLDDKQRHGANLAVTACVPSGDAASSPRCTPSTCGTRAWTSTTHQAVRRAGQPGRTEAVRPERGQGPHQGQHEGVRQADPRSWTGNVASAATRR